jgi:hypothetical protein
VKWAAAQGPICVNSSKIFPYISLNLWSDLCYITFHQLTKPDIVRMHACDQIILC